MNKTLSLIVLAACSALATPALASDNDVQWDGVSHIGWLDRTPRVPLDGEAFLVRFQAYRDDLTAARVRIDDGAIRWAEAAKIASRGPYDIWQAEVPSTAAAQLSYIFELTDGGDTDYLAASGVSDDLPAGGFEIDYDTLAHAPVGATVVPGGAVFKVWTPTSSSVNVRGTFNGWDTSDALSKVGEHFAGFVPGAGPGDQYKYFFNGSLWNSDARALRLNPTDNYNSFVVDLDSYDWQVDGFSPAPTEQLVIYQLHVGTFAGRNDPYGPADTPSGYRDVGDRAAHLAELGVNAVMINPINEFPGDFSGGYNPISKWAVEWRLGTPDDLKYMIDALHAEGIAVLLDIVWNHFSSADNYLWNYDGTQLYFDTPHVDTPWGAQADFGRAGVRAYFLESALLMLDEYRFDGFRMDATGFMDIQDGGWSLMQELNEIADRRFVDKVIIAEQLPDNAWITRPVSLGGAGFDGQYHDAFTDNLREQVFGAAFGDPEMWKIRDAVNGSGQYLSGSDVVNYFELHDEAWTLSGGQRAVKTIDTTFPHDDEFARGRTTLAQGLTMLAPGVPALLMGTEWLEDAGFESEKIDWSKRTTYAGVFAYYQALIGLRTGEADFFANSPHKVSHLNEGGNVIGFARGGAGEFFVIANFSDNDWGSYRVGLPRAGAWGEVLSNQDSDFGGSGFGNDGPVATEAIPYDGYAQSATIKIPARGLLVLQHEPPVQCSGDLDGDGDTDQSDLGLLLAAYGIDAAGDLDGDGDTDQSDLGILLADYGCGT
jgi:1,4-alpha-glucan branching enzyme